MGLSSPVQHPSSSSKSSEAEPTGPFWYCVHTKPKSEHLAAAALLAFGEVETFCPRLRFQRSTARGKVWFTEALFPSYFFAKFDLAARLRAVKHANHVIGVVGFGGMPVPLPEETIVDLRAEMQGKEIREISHGVQVGDTVEVAEGPMRGLKGIVESLANSEERVKILLEFLGRQSLVEVPKSKLLSDRGPRESFTDK
ncbi:MAG TPA: transcription termination/antitermination NusG family protein [Candidatus Saccharimonadia bacterium]|nr:transcription termination/antitermination NusG family protein [Candidatus Saccharimonadia bacterium]